VKTLEEFDYTQPPHVTAAKMRDLAEGGYIERTEPVLFIGNTAPARLTCSRDCAWRRAGKNAGSASPPPPVWFVGNFV